MKVTGVGDPCVGCWCLPAPGPRELTLLWTAPGLACAGWVPACLPESPSWGSEHKNSGCGASSAFWLLFSQRCQVSQVAQACVTALELLQADDLDVW